jgi:hypothetical protein
MVITGEGFYVILGNQGMGGVALAASGPILMPGMVPTFIRAVHDMAVVTGGRVIAQVGRKFCCVQTRTEYCNKGNHPYEKGQFHIGPPRSYGSGFRVPLVLLKILKDR